MAILCFLINSQLKTRLLTVCINLSRVSFSFFFRVFIDFLFFVCLSYLPLYIFGSCGLCPWPFIFHWFPFLFIYFCPRKMSFVSITLSPLILKHYFFLSLLPSFSSSINLLLKPSFIFFSFLLIHYHFIHNPFFHFILFLLGFIIFSSLLLDLYLFFGSFWDSFFHYIFFMLEFPVLALLQPSFYLIISI